MCGPSPIPVVTSHGGWSRITTTLLEAPANPAGRSSPRTLLLPRLPCRQPLRSLPPCGPSVSERAPAQHSSEVLRELPSRTGLTVTLRETIQKGRLSPGETQTPTPEPPQPRVPVAWNPRVPSLCWPASSWALTTTHSSFQEGLWALPGAWVRPGAQNTSFSPLEQPKPLLFGSCTLLAPGILTVCSSPWHPVPVTYDGFLPASLAAQTVKNLPAMQETQVPSLGQEDSLEKEMAVYSSILAWRIPWTEEPGGL